MKLIKNILLFFTLTIVVYLTAVFAMCKLSYQGKPLIYITNDYFVWKGGDTYEKYQEFDSLDSSLDIIFLGSSRTYRHYNPLAFEENGISSFNLGSHAQSIKNSYFVFKDYIVPRNPKMVVFDIYYNAFATEGFESSTDLVTNISSDKTAANIVKSAPDARLINTLLVRKFIKNRGSMYLNDDYIGKGFANKRDTISEADIKRIESNKSTLVDYKVDQWKYLEKLLELAREQKIKVILTTSPASPSYQKEQRENFNKELNKHILKYQVEYWDFSNLKGISWKNHFHDNAHMNIEGVNIFNYALLDKINFYIKCQEN